MKKLTIGIDLDGVVFRTLDRVLERYNEKNKTCYQSDDIRDWDTHKWLDNDMSIYDFFIDPDLFRDLPLAQGAQEVLYRLDKVHDIFLVTDTHHSCLAPRMEELVRLFPPKDYHFMADRKIFVGKFKELLMLDVLLDDKPTNIEHFKRRGYGVPIVFDWKLNRHMTDVIRVRDWWAFEKEIEKIAQEKG